MKVNFNGMRKKTTNNMNTLFFDLDNVIQRYGKDEMKDVIKSFNEAAQSVDVFNCLEDDKNSEFKSLDIEIKRFNDE